MNARLTSPFCRVLRLSALSLLAYMALPAYVSAQSFADRSAQWMDAVRGWLPAGIFEMGLRILSSLLIFLVGWLVAKFVAYLVYRLLCKTDVDDKIAEALGINLAFGKSEQQGDNALERSIAKVVFYMLLLLVVVGVLQHAGLTLMAGPIQGLVHTLVQALPFIGKAALILLAAYVAGRVLKAVLIKTLQALGVDRRFAELAQQSEADKNKAGTSFSHSVGNVAFWLLIIVGLAGALETLQIRPIADPLRNAIDRVVTLLPSIAVAVLLLVIGYVLGRIARIAVANLLRSIGFDALAERLALGSLTGKQSPSAVMGIVAMVFIMLQCTVAALNAVHLETLSLPLTHMMSQFWQLLPALLVSLLFVAVGIIAGRILRRLVTTLLGNIKFDERLQALGFATLPERGESTRSYAHLVGYTVQAAVVLVALAQALQNLELTRWSHYLHAFLSYAVTHIAVALLIVVAGIAIANYVRDVVIARRGSNEGQLRWVAEFLRYAVLIFAFTMAVQQLDVAQGFVLLSFGLLFGALCLAFALAFGMGSRDVAGDIVRRRYERARSFFEGAGKDNAADD